jgi:hypothetical protein
MSVRKQIVQGAGKRQIPQPKEQNARYANQLLFSAFPKQWQIGPNPAVSNMCFQNGWVIQRTAQKKIGRQCKHGYQKQ